jgi:Icc protein
VEARDRTLRALRGLDRRTLFKVSAASAGAALAKGLVPPHSFQLVEVANAAVDKNWARTGAQGKPPFTFAYISDTHLYTKKLNERFVRGALKAVEDVNALDPQPDFVLFGGDLAQLGRKDEMRLGAEILKEVKAPIKIMVGEHDWFLDMGETWQDLFGPPNYSFDWKGASSSH